jgi:multidrug resistance efflux pump
MSDLGFEVRAPLGLTLADGTRVTLPEWSLDGFTYPRDIDVLPREAELSIPFQGVDIRFPVRLAAAGDGRRMRFEGLTGRQRETLAVFYRSLLNGRMAATDEIITSLDTPVDLVPMGETEEEERTGRARARPRAMRAALSVGSYLLLAALVFWTLGAGIYGKLANVEIRNARIEVPFTDHAAPAEAYVKSIAVAPGDEVAVGDTLVRLTTSEGELALTEVRSEITRVEDRIARVQARLAEVAAEMDESRAALQRRLGESATSFETLPLPPGLVAQQARLRSELDQLRRELRPLRKERGRWRAANDALILRADEAGRVTELFVMQGQYVARGMRVVQTEADRARHARGWVSQDLAAALAPGLDVRVLAQTPEGKRTLRGRIAALEGGIDPALSAEPACWSPWPSRRWTWRRPARGCRTLCRSACARSATGRSRCRSAGTG